MRKHTYVKKTPTNLRTSITDISPLGYELSDESLRMVVGGQPRQSWVQSTSITNPGQPDTEVELRAD